MFQTDQATAATSLPTPATAGTQGYFTNGNPAGGTPATIVDADWLNMIQQELINVVTGAGETPSKTTYNQVLLAIKRLVQSPVVLTDTGSANAYAAVNTPALTNTTWANGVVQQVIIAHANTGASTYAPDGLTAIPIYGLGLQALQGGELFVGGTAVLMKATIAGINSGNPICVLMECAGGAQQIAPATQSQHAVNLGQFGASLASNGYCKLPNGMIMQWGTGTFPNSGIRTSTVTVTIPLTWPNGYLSATGNVNSAANTSAGGIPSVGISANTATTITFIADTLGYTTFNETATFNWIAIGH